ncbi:uncharacterized protein E0L32_009122 [Thyridium curvatum]|uniref:Telomeric single stranded DNA binding POT1/Cdc13 domain-containing protein n=1 Tax=Thyridium curvatum TaxID=1093900 RepID=A0A507AXD5_9PEZI|nr:uncharacterized protein E0L32_009122 [Thyridium curvatum]TPX09649.1 hypothetical protein E0L32_009122 [Thyridium curvatum]
MPATDKSAPAQILATAQQTPIAQLSPDLPAPASRVVRGEVTITWPYNSLKQTLAFLLAEPDVRLRRTKGQVRVELQGPSAKAAAACNLGGGDQLALSLDGVAWAKDQSTARQPGSRIEWQLKFTGKLLLEVKSGEEEQGVKYVNIDEPTPIDNPEPTLPAIPDPVEREITPPAPPRPAIQRVVANDEPEEFSSPAFIKRARVSYGSLFESGFDIFEDDGGVKGKGRKRTRFGRDSSAWRYASHSPSPEPEEEQASESEEIARATALSSPPRTQMTDEGCQTVELDIPVASPRIETPHPVEQTHSAHPAEPDVSLPLPPTTVNGTTTSPMAVDIPTQEPPQAEGLTTSSEPFGSALFGSFMPSGDAFGSLNQFPTANSAASFGENQIPISDQVRFGFAQPIASMEPTPHAISNLLHAPLDTHEHYPEEHLGSGNASIQHAEFGFEEREAASALIAQQSALPAPPANDAEVHGEGMVWPITSETLDAQHAEGHVDLALPPEPTAVASEVDTASRSPTRQTLPREVDDYGYNARRYQNEAEERMIGMVDRPEEDDEEDSEDDDAVDHNEEEPDDAGDDYDMRNYADVDDDEDGFEQYDDEEGGEYPEGEMLSPDDEEGSYDEDEGEEDYESDDEEQQHGAAQSPAAPPGPPVVIDLISDSEDEDQPPPQHAAKAMPSAFSQQTAQAPRVEQASEGVLEDEGGHARHDIPAHTFGQPFAAAGSIMTTAAQQPSDEVESAGSPSYGVQSDDNEEDYEEDADADALGESDEEPEEENSDDEADDVEMDRPLNPQPVDVEEPEVIEEEVGEQRIEISETVQITQEVDTETTTVAKTTSTTIATSNADMDSTEIVETIIETRKSPVSRLEPQVLTTDSTAMGDVSRHENIDKGNIAPSSPPLSQQIKSQVFGDQPLMLSSPLPSSQLQEDQLPTPRETQQKEGPTSRHESDMLVDEEIDEHEPSPAPRSTALPQSELSEKEPEEVELFSMQPETGDQEEDAPMVDLVSEEPQVPPAEVISEEPTASSPIPKAKESNIGDEGDQPQATQASKDTIEVTPALVEKEQVVEPVEEAVKPGQEDDEQGAVPPDASQPGRDHQEDSVKLQDDSKRDEEPAEPSAAEGPAVHTRSRTKDTKEPPPAKSTTRTKAKPAPIDPSIQLARAARRGKRHQEPESPTVTTRARSRSVQQSATPELQDASVQLARAALQSPSRKTHHPPAPPAAAAAAKTSTASAASLKLELAKRLRSDLPECVALKTLKSHLNRKLDVLAIATTASSEATRLKTRQYALSFNVTDPSTAPLHVVEVQVYRAHKDSLPAVKPGDGVLLRGFQVVALTGKDFGLRSDEASGYAVFEQEGSGEPQINGPPVEDIDAEAGYAETLKEWYRLLDSAAKDKLAKANKKFADVTAGKSK